MAIAAACTWEVRTTGSDSNGGAFKTGAAGTDRSQQDAAQVAIDNAAITTSITTTVITFTAGYTPTSADVGNVVQMLTGTNVTAGFYEITAQTSTTWTVDRNVVTSGTTTNATGNMGGALVSPGKAGSGAVAGNRCYIKSGTYTITSATANIAAGCVTWPNQAAAANTGKILGYGSSRDDGGTKPLLQASGISTFTLITVGTSNHIEYVSCDGAGLTSSRGINASNATAFRCKALNCTNNGFNAGELLLCEATGCSTTAAFAAAQCIGCYAYSNTNVGFSNNSGSALLEDCIAANNSGASTDGFDSAFGAGHWVNCTSYGNGRDGFRFNGGATNAGSSFINCLAYGNTGVGINVSSTNDTVYYHKCAGGSNTGGNTSGVTAANNDGFVTLSADPFTNAGSSDFSLNNTAGGGASLRAAGYPAVFPNATTTSYEDIGAVRHQDPAGGGGNTILAGMGIGLVVGG